VSLFRNHRPAEVIMTDISEVRLEEVRPLTPARCELVASAQDHDRLLGAMPRASLIVNATGMGKDRPGSPVTDQARFPADSIAWDFNYRGDLAWLDWARQQSIRTVNGWSYFLHGWSQVMSRVYGFELTPELFAGMADVASS
jgi:shikimate 5-dehydrogenase